MRHFMLILASFLLLTFVSCQKEQTPTIEPQQPEYKYDVSSAESIIKAADEELWQAIYKPSGTAQKAEVDITIWPGIFGGSISPLMCTITTGYCLIEISPAASKNGETGIESTIILAAPDAPELLHAKVTKIVENGEQYEVFFDEN